ncbi:MAG: hypothetical protein SPL00_04845 [Bacilli bacterium]|nr:hypothetical protein [Bacilli bacterium]
MKRSALLLIPLVLGLASCGGKSTPAVSSSGIFSSSTSEVTSSSSTEEFSSSESTDIPERETVEKVKELLSRQDLSEFYTKAIIGSYIQEYDVFEINYDEDSKVSSYFNYDGRGMFGFYYDLKEDQYGSIVDEKGNIEIFDAIAKGLGYYGLLQVIRTMSFNRVDGAEADINNLDIFQQMTLKTTDDEVWVGNTLYASNDGVFHYDTRQELQASINKELLFSSISTRTFRETFSKVDLFNTPANMEHLDRLYYSICRDLVTESDEEISNFVVENQISIEEDEDNIKVNFVFLNEDIDEEEADFIFPGEIKGTLFYDKETYEFTNFSYEMVYKIETFNEETGSIRVINTKFTCSGDSSRVWPHEAWQPTDPIVYDDVADFLEDVNEQVVPPNINL